MAKNYFLTIIIIILYSVSSYSQSLTVTGTIKDEHGDPLSGVTVFIEETKAGTTTNNQGQFSISGKVGQKITARFLGYFPYSFEFKNSQTSVTFSMEPENKVLDDLVVIGYGTARKSDVTGSVESLKSSDLNRGSVLNAAQMLEGRVPGLYIRSANQDPGATNDIILRGIGSLEGSSHPLIVIDGFPTSGLDALNTIAPSDIKQIDILKDASASAIYGSRGANGVIIITTKQGESGMVVDFTIKQSVQQLGNEIKMMDANQYIYFYYDLANDPSYELQLGQGGYMGNQYLYPLESVGKTANTNWQQQIVTPKLNQDYSISISNGNANIKYRLSANYSKQNSIIGPADYERFNFGSYLTYIKGKFGYDMNAVLNVENLNRVKNSYLDAIRFQPTVSVRDNDGNLSRNPLSDDAQEWRKNPLWNQFNTRDFEERNLMRMMGSLNYELFKGLNLKLKGGYERTFSERFISSKKHNKLTHDFSQIYPSNRRNIVIDFNANYQGKFEKHSITAMFGTSYQSFRNRLVDIKVEQFPNDDIGIYDIGAGIGLPTFNSGWSERRITSLFARTAYNYDDRYLATINFRRDGATQFGENNKWGNFPSFSVAWRVDNEEFFKRGTIQSLKVIAGYGWAGNADVPIGRTQALMEYWKTYLGDGAVNGVRWNTVNSRSFIPNPNLKWESSQTINIGIEMVTRRISTEINVYNKLTSDMLISRQVPSELGFSYITLNKGSMNNRGVEAKIKYNLYALNNTFRWTPSAWFTFNDNKVTSLDGDKILHTNITVERLNYGFAGFTSENYPVGALWAYKYLGVWQKEENAQAATYGAKPGDAKFFDKNSDGKYDEEDKYYFGDTQPKILIGFNNNITFQDWNLNFTLDGVFNKKVVNSIKVSTLHPSIPFYYSNLNKLALERWTPDYTDTNIPSLTRPLASQLMISDFCYEDASFVRMKEITLTYNMKMKRKAPISSIRIFTTANNLFTLTNYSGLNPDAIGIEQQTGQFSSSLLPVVKTYMIGVNFIF